VKGVGREKGKKKGEGGTKRRRKKEKKEGRKEGGRGGWGGEKACSGGLSPPGCVCQAAHRVERPEASSTLECMPRGVKRYGHAARATLDIKCRSFQICQVSDADLKIDI